MLIIIDFSKFGSQNHENNFLRFMTSLSRLREKNLGTNRGKKRVWGAKFLQNTFFPF